MVDRSVVGAVRSYLEALAAEGAPVSFGVLFGSQAKGAAHRWSDIDLLVVSPQFDAAYSHDDVDRLWRVASGVDPRIQPVACGARQWLDDDGCAIIEIARREGVAIYPERQEVSASAAPVVG